MANNHFLRQYCRCLLLGGLLSLPKIKEAGTKIARCLDMG